MNPQSLRVITRDGALEVRSLVAPSANEVVLVKAGREYGVTVNDGRRVVDALSTCFDGRMRGIPALHPDGHRWYWLFTSYRPHALFYGRRGEAGVVLKVVGEGQRLEVSISSDEAVRWTAAVRNSAADLLVEHSAPA